jgi:hypothetical protein
MIKSPSYSIIYPALMFFHGSEVCTAIEDNVKNVYAAEIRLEKSGAGVTFINQVNNKYIREEIKINNTGLPKSNTTLSFTLTFSVMLCLFCILQKNIVEGAEDNRF